MNRNLHERVEREREAHTERDVSAANLRIRNRFAHITQYPSHRRIHAKQRSYTSELAGKIVLDYGCGRGQASLIYLNRGAAKVCGIDISPVYIQHATDAAHRAGYDEDRFSFRVMDAHQLTFEDGSFDLVIGNGILHHLDSELALREIYRVLKPGGRTLLHEPLADNPLLKLFRLLTPHARTEDETPFTGAAIRSLLSKNDWQADMVYAGILEAPVAMITSLLMPRRPENGLLRWTDVAERWMHERRILLSWNQQVLFNMVKRPDGRRAA